jgi:DNA-binding response OmpR family regulator
MTSHPSAGARVLIIDDDERLNALLTKYLTRFGFSVRTVNHPEEGLRALKLDPPDLLVLDIMLPSMDGLAVCRRVRETSRVPIIMLTARGDVTDRIVGLELGADDYLPKLMRDMTRRDPVRTIIMLPPGCRCLRSAFSKAHVTG